MGWRGIFGCLLVLLVWRVGLAAEAALGPGSAETRAIQSRLQSDEWHVLHVQAPLLRLYALSEHQPLWHQGVRLLPEAHQAMEMLRSAPGHGLEVAVYGDLPLLEQRLRSGDVAERVAADVALSAALLHFLGDLHRGRVHPRLTGAELDWVVPDVDLGRAVWEARKSGRLLALPDSLAPQLAMYAALRRALLHYRDLAPIVEAPLPVVKKLEPGQSYPALAALRNRLVRLGDMAAELAVPSLYQGALVEAVKRFQMRHGLEADGIIGRSTFLALNTSYAQRLEQLILALERLRWLRLPANGQLILVNIPEFRLRGLVFQEGRGEVRLTMNVIVGKAVLAQQTPVFDEAMRSIDFRPFWNVPPSIAKVELLPKLKKHPGYLAEQEMELLPVAGGPASTELTPEAVEEVALGQLRIRQRPGSKNPLGPIKFVLPNNHDVYLHYTSSPHLFAKVRRDFSHGCIRVEEPVKLAQFVLEDQPTWTEERIRAAMEADTPSSVRLHHPIPVVIFYTTVVMGDDGRPQFLPDIYGLDPKLSELLHKAVGRDLRGVGQTVSSRQ